MEPKIDHETSFKEFFNNEYANACRYANSYLNDYQLAEDAVQEVFIKLWEQKRDIISSSGARFYLITSVKNKCISVLRAKGDALVFPESAPEAGQDSMVIPMQHKEHMEEQKRKIEAALNHLPPACKEVFLLIKLYDMSYKQAAEHLDISVKTIENQMGKALKIFRSYAAQTDIVLIIIGALKDLSSWACVSTLF